MLDVLRRGGPQLESQQLPASGANKRRKLGRTLNEIQASLEKS